MFKTIRPKLKRQKRTSLKAHIIIISVLFILSIFSFMFDGIVGVYFMEHQSRLMSYLMGFVSSAEFMIFALLIITTIYLYQKNKKEEIIPLWISLNITLLFTYYLKFFFARPRPIGMMYTFFGLPDFSFPSTHVALAFSVLAIMDEGFTHINWAWLFLAIIIAISRLYLSVHFFSDVIFGALIGYMIGFAMMKFEEKHGAFKTWNSHIWK